MNQTQVEAAARASATGVYYEFGSEVMVTAYGSLKVGPRVWALLEERRDPPTIDRVCTFVGVWHALEWLDEKNPVETP